ncbi:MAG: hypothetical protein ACKOHH_06730 [Bacteroidota bacterium]
MMMTTESRKVAGLILISMPSIIYGGYFLLSILIGQQDALGLTDFQKAMFRAGHAHAGVLVILAILAQVLVDQTSLSGIWKWVVRLSFVFAGLFISMGFFASAMGVGRTTPNGAIVLIYVGMAILTVGMLGLGLGLFRSKA